MDSKEAINKSLNEVTSEVGRIMKSIQAQFTEVDISFGPIVEMPSNSMSFKEENK